MNAPRVTDVQVRGKLVRVILSNGQRRVGMIPVCSRLRDASDEQRANWREIGQGAGIHWPDVDEDLSVEAMAPYEFLEEPAPAPAVTGYRQLPAEDIALINEVKAAGAALDALQRRVVEHIQFADSAAAWAQAEGLPAGHATRYGDALRAAAIAKTELQTGLMWLTRAVAQPDGFA